MRIYKLCPCCGGTIFLVMEMELGSAFGSKDNMPHSDANHEEDYRCLNKLLSCLETSHGKVYISLNEKEQDKIPKEHQELILKWTEKGYKKSEEATNNNSNNQGGNHHHATDNKDWTNIHRDFAQGDYKQNWIRAGFNYEQTQDWINIGMTVLDCFFCAWLRGFKRMTAEQVLNYGNVSALRREWEDTLTHEG